MVQMAEENNFEVSLKRLEDVVQLLETGNLSLEDALALYAEGVALTRSCQGLLSQAEQQVRELQVGLSLPNDGREG